MTDPDPDTRTLADRARLLAEPAVVPASGETIALVECRLGPERYGLRLDAVREIVRAGRFAPLPCTPPHVAGVANLRGAVVPVLDLRTVLGLAPAPPSEASVVAVVAWGAQDCGLLFDRADRVRTLGAADLLPPPSRAGGAAAPYLEGATRDGLLLLDLASLVGDERLVVDEQTAVAPLFTRDILPDERRSPTSTNPPRR